MDYKESVVLFGEGKTDAVFLKHLYSLYQHEIKARVNIDAAQGGSPKMTVERLIKKHLTLGSYDRSLLLIDEDLPRDEIPQSLLKNNRITVVTSAPRCLEGVFLSMLKDSPPPKYRLKSSDWKRRFHKNYLGTDRDGQILTKLANKCPSLFPRKFIESHRSSHPTIHSILNFLGV